MTITETIEFWILVYVSELMIAGLASMIKHLRSKKENLEKTNSSNQRKTEILLLSYGAVLVLYIVGAIRVFSNDPDYQFFWISILFTMIVLVISTYVSVVLSGKSNNTMKEILDGIRRIETELSKLPSSKPNVGN